MFFKPSYYLGIKEIICLYKERKFLKLLVGPGPLCTLSTRLLRHGIKMQHNKPDLIIVDHDEKPYRVIKFRCPADINVTSKLEEKVTKNSPIIRNLSIVCRNYCFKMLPLVIDALGIIPTATR